MQLTVITVTLEILTFRISITELKAFYETWAQHYDNDVLAIGYGAPKAITEEALIVCDEEAKKSWKVLDLGSGERYLLVLKG